MIRRKVGRKPLIREKIQLLFMIIIEKIFTAGNI